MLTVLCADGVPRRLVRTPFRSRAPSSSTPTCHPALLPAQQQEPGATQLHCSQDYGRPHAYSTQNMLPFPFRPAPRCPLRALGSTFPGLCGLRQGADDCSMLETSLHSPRHSRIIRNTYATLTQTPQGRSCFSKAPNAAGALV